MSQSQDLSKKSSLKLGLFLNESLFFLLAQGLGLYAGYSLFQQGVVPSTDTSGSILSFLIAFIFATAFILVMLKYFKGGRFFKFLLAFLIFAGSQTIFGLFLPAIISFIAAILLVVLRFKKPSIIVQNLAIIIAIAGIGASIGTLLPFEAILVIVAVLVVYDIIAVYKTKHMVSMFKGMVEKGAPLSIVIPDKAKDIHTHIQEAQPGTGKFMMLGSGDIAFPIILSVSALRFGIIPALAVIVGSFVGLLSIHFLFLAKGRGAIPALPPILFFSIIFLIATAYITGGL